MLNTPAGETYRRLPVPDKEFERPAGAVQVSQAKKEWQAIVDAVPNLIFLTDMARTVLRCNQAVCHTLERSYRDILGRSVTELLGEMPTSGAEGKDSLLAEHIQDSGQPSEIHLPQLESWFVVTQHLLQLPEAEGEQGIVYSSSHLRASSFLVEPGLRAWCGRARRPALQKEGTGRRQLRCAIYVHQHHRSQAS